MIRRASTDLAPRKGTAENHTPNHAALNRRLVPTVAPADIESAAAVVVADALTGQERKELRESEEVIARGARAWLEMGRALTDIRDKRLYRETHDTFAEYCWQTFHLERSVAYRLIEATNCFRLAAPIAEKLRLEFTALSQFAPIAKCEAAELPTVLRLAAKGIEPNADGLRVPTAKILAAAVRKIRCDGDGPANGRGTPAAARAPRAVESTAGSSGVPSAAAWRGLAASSPRASAAAMLDDLAALLDEAIQSFPDEALADVAALLRDRADGLEGE